MLGRVVVEREQHVQVVGDLRGGLGPLGAELGGERLRRGAGVGLVLGVVDLGQRLLRAPGGPTWAARPRRCRSCATSTAARRVSGNTSRTAFQNPSAPSPTASTGAVMPRRLAVAQQIGPRLDRFAEPVGQRDQLLAAIGTDPDHHQQAHLVVLQPHLEVDAVDPHVDVVGAGQRPGVERPRPRLATARSAG